MDAREVIARAIAWRRWSSQNPELAEHATGQIVPCAYDWEDADAALSAYHAHLEASGMAIVPVEATEAMVDAGDAAGAYFPSDDLRDIYRAMIAAAKDQTDGR